MAEPEAAATPAETTSATPRHMPRWRRILVAVLVVVACVLTPICVVGVWARNTVLDTDQYVATMQPLARNPDIQRAIANRVAQAVVSGTDLQSRIESAIPQAKFVAPVITGTVQEYVATLAQKIVASDQFAALWDKLNRLAHSQVVAVLEGKGIRNTSTQDGKVVLDLSPVVNEVKDKLASVGVKLNGSGPVGTGKFVLFQSAQLRKAQKAVSILDTMAYVTPAIILALLAVAIALSPDRRRTVLRAALGIALSTAILLALFAVARHFYLNAVADKAAGKAAYNQILSFLRTSARTVTTLALVVALGAWLAGPGRHATRVRTYVVGLLRGHVGSSRVTAFVHTYRAVLRGVVVGLALLILIWEQAPTPLTVILLAVLVLIGLAVIELLNRANPAASEATPDDGPDDEPSDDTTGGPTEDPPVAAVSR
jgi:hypothetical protein